LDINAEIEPRKPILIDEFQNKKMIIFLKEQMKAFTIAGIKRR